jgi:hypothetical protein
MGDVRDTYPILVVIPLENPSLEYLEGDSKITLRFVLGK